MNRIQKAILRWRKPKLTVPKPSIKLRVGNVQYRVVAEINDYNLGFHRRKDAEAYGRLLRVSDNPMRSDIVRTETTEEGFHLH